MKLMPTPKLVLLLSVLFLCSFEAVEAELLAEESFLVGSDSSVGEYENNVSVIGKDPTVLGFTGAWSGGVATAETGTLTYSDGSGSIASAGGKVRMGGNDRAGRELTQKFDGNTVGTFYLGLLYQQSTITAGYRGFTLYDGSVSSGSRVFNVFADSTTDGVLRVTNSFGGGSGSSVALGDESIDTNVNFFVFEFNFSADDMSDSVLLYMNPDLATGPSSGSLVYSDADLNIAFDHLGLERFTGSGTTYNTYMDEVRLSQSFNEVSTVPVPESQSYALIFGVGLWGYCLMRRSV